MNRKRFRFGIRRKLILGVTGISLITYGVSAIFIFFLSDFFTAQFGISEDGMILAVLLLGLIWSAIFAYLLAPVITKPIARVTDAARITADGNIQAEIPVTKSDDELRELALAFNDMSQNLRVIVQEIDEHSKGTHAQAGELSTSSQDAASRTKDITYTVGEIANGSENTAQAIQSIAESMEDMTKIADDVNDRATSSKEASTEMVTILKKSRENTLSLWDGINEIENRSEQSLEAMGKLEEGAQKVEEIINLVGDIADQTNLLALNASIEAARAGEHGRGFAVVANEVRKLADESSDAVQNITSLIKSIQDDVSRVSTEIQTQVEISGKEASKGKNTKTVIDQFVSSCTDVAKAVDAITQLVGEQREAIQQTSQQSQEVAAIAEQTSAGAQQVTAASESQNEMISAFAQAASTLTTQADDLRKTTSKFSA
ncbi:methyl-accepting chemotaxis protein [Salicibibacter cibarius]|uniref:Methyl-accepting chemotaxis protein n=1 Tax=Salicibibacter cibarius TaxID=2743000 RepID=A0A7T6YZY8_9BACI|nr:methyl-accepting chemotaxis protein [Salicibibacter cibarius]QQK74377.1 methyl-accepting chemotaxis protein [Salicibibacter cibarius]